MRYQPRFEAYLQHSGVDPNNFKGYEFMNWIGQKWREYEQISKVKRPYSQQAHEGFTEWLIDTAPILEGQLELAI